VIGIAGSMPLEPDMQLNQYFDVLVPVNNDIGDRKAAIQNTKANLIRTGQMIGDLMSIRYKLNK
jgi:hypothetical protein